MVGLLFRRMREKRIWKLVEASYADDATQRIERGEYKRAVDLLDASFEYRSSYVRQQASNREEEKVFDYYCHALQGIACYLDWSRSLVPSIRMDSNGIQDGSRSYAHGCFRLMHGDGVPEESDLMEKKEKALSLLAKAIDQYPRAKVLPLLFAHLCACSDDWERGIKELKRLWILEGHGNFLALIQTVLLEASLYKDRDDIDDEENSSGVHAGNAECTGRSNDESIEGTRGGHWTGLSKDGRSDVPLEWLEAPKEKLVSLYQLYDVAARGDPSNHIVHSRLLLLSKHFREDLESSFAQEINILAQHLDVCSNCTWGWQKLSGLLLEYGSLRTPNWSFLHTKTWQERLILWRKYHFSTCGMKIEHVIPEHQSTYAQCLCAKMMCAALFFGHRFQYLVLNRVQVRKWDPSLITELNNNLTKIKVMRGMLQSSFHQTRDVHSCSSWSNPSPAFWKVFPQYRRASRIEQPS